MSLIFSVFAGIPLTAHAADNVWYYFRYWKSDGSYVDREIRYADAQLLQNMDDGIDDLYTGWYYSQGSKEFSDRVTVHGEVNIILTDSSYVKFKDGIEVSSGNTLNIYGQDRDDQYLEALAESWDAAIGSDDETGSCGNITIYGGGVKADSRGSYHNDNAGIGGGNECDGGNVTIYGGHVQAYGGANGAGIGGGDEGNGGSVTIYGGTVEAYGGSSAAGIGGGDADGAGGKGGTIRIYGGEITAKGGSNAAGIGGGDNGEGENITIAGGSVVATGGKYGAGIGGGQGKGSDKIKIQGGKTYARGGDYAAGVGGGQDGSSGTIEISGHVEANGGKNAAGIGGGKSGSSGTIEFVGETDVTVYGGINAAGIGGGEGGNGGTITISGGTIEAKSKGNGAGIGGGEDAGDGSITISGGTTTVKPAEGQQSLKGNSINLSDDSAAFKGICVRKPGGSTAPKNERISWCTSTDKNELVIAPCEHADCTFTYKDQGVHARSCNHCTCTGDAPHTLGTPVWNWANDYSSAAPAAVCTDCGRELSFAAAVTATAEDDRIIHTASFEYNNTVYTDVKESFADSIGAKVIGHSISLEGDIGVNFYMELADDIANSDTAYMRFEIPRTGDPDTRTVYVKDASKVSSGDDTFYVFKCQVAAKEMTSGIKGQIVDGDRTGNIYRYSVKEYADYLLTHANADGTDEEKAFAKASDLVRRMLNYGAYSQIYFDKNPDILANESLSENDKKLGDVEIDTADPVLDTLPEGVTFEGATLSLKSETTLSLYFKSSNTLSFSCGGYTVETTRSGGYQIARIRGIHAARIGDLITLNVNGAQVRYSPLNYCRNVLKGGTADEKLRNVAKALYQYWYAAGWYFDEQTSAS